MKQHLASFLALGAIALLCHPAAGQTVVNPSFETDAVPPTPGYGPITGWTGGSGLNDSTGPFADNGAIPNGLKVAFMQGAGTLRQTVSGFVVGTRYRLRYYENARLGTGTANLQVTVGGVTVVAPHVVPAVGGSMPYVLKTSEAFTASAESLEIAFVASGSGDFAVLLDNIVIGRNLVVTSVANAQAGSLRQTVLDAPAGSIITFDLPPASTIYLYGQITVDKSLSIVGPGSNQLVLRNMAAQSPTSRLFWVTGSPVAISGISLTHGSIPGNLLEENSYGGGGIYASGQTTLTDVTISDCFAGTGAKGGGLYSGAFGTLTVNNCTISNNTATLGSGIFGRGRINNSVITGNYGMLGLNGNAQGGGVWVFTTGMTIDNSTISNNTAQGGDTNDAGGGGIFASGTTTLTNTTVSNNQTLTYSDLGTSGCSGAGIYILSNASVTLINSTVANNAARYLAGPDFPQGMLSKGGGIYVPVIGTVILRNSIVAANTLGSGSSGVDISGNVTSQGYNLIGSNGGTAITGTTTGNIVGTYVSPVDPRLAPLAFYGGVTPTHALLTTSPAINAGNAAPSPAVDQRGAARVGTADIGALELNNTANAGTYVAILPQGVLLFPYAFTLVPNNVAFGSTFTYTVTSGTLPAGISLTTQTNVVTLSGTPTVAGTFNFAITASNGTRTHITNYRLTVPANPTVASISPSSGSPGGSESVTITGTGFTGATGVSIGGTPVLIFRATSDTSITAITPPHAFGPASVVVSRATVANAANTLYTYLSALYTQGQYDASRTAGQTDVTGAPNTYNLYTAAQYGDHYTAGQNNVITSPNTYNLYTLSQVQTLNVGTPLLVKDPATGLFKLTIAVRKTPNLATTPFTSFPMNGPGMTHTLNAQGNLDFVFPVTDSAAFFRLESSP